MKTFFGKTVLDLHKISIKSYFYYIQQFILSKLLSCHGLGAIFNQTWKLCKFWIKNLRIWLWTSDLWPCSRLCDPAARALISLDIREAARFVFLLFYGLSCGCITDVLTEPAVIMKCCLWTERNESDPSIPPEAGAENPQTKHNGRLVHSFTAVRQNTVGGLNSFCDWWRASGTRRPRLNVSQSRSDYLAQLRGGRNEACLPCHSPIRASWWAPLSAGENKRLLARRVYTPRLFYWRN